MSLEKNQNDKLEAGQQFIHRDLVIACQRGERLAQNELYKLYAKAMFNICRRMMVDEDEAKDLLQEVFIEVFTKVSNLKEVNTFSAWIKRITINKCINALKKKKLFTLSIDESLDVPEEDSFTEDNVISHEAKKIMSAVDQISDGCRTVLNLYLFEGYDHKEIGQILKISESASKSQYSKARAKIRAILEDQESRSYGN